VDPLKKLPNELGEMVMELLEFRERVSEVSQVPLLAITDIFTVDYFKSQRAGGRLSAQCRVCGVFWTSPKAKSP